MTGIIHGFTVNKNGSYQIIKGLKKTKTVTGIL